MAETKKKATKSSKNEELKKSTISKKSSTAKAKKTTSTRTKKSTKAELKAQEAKKKIAIKKTTKEIAAEKAQEAKAKKAVEKDAKLKAQKEIEKLKEVADSSKRKVTKIKKTKSELIDLKLNVTKKQDEQQLTKVIFLDFDNSNLPKKLFSSSKIYNQAIFDTILSERASRRQGTHDVKNRSEVRGTGKKPWRQKGTGRARTGSLRTPIFVGGGRAFGPTPERNYKIKINKKVRKAAFVSALTLLAKNKSVLIDDFAMKSISTREAVAKLEHLKLNKLKHILIVTNDEKVYKSVRNLQNVICVRPNSVSIEQLIGADVLLLSKEGLKLFEGRVK